MNKLISRCMFSLAVAVSTLSMSTASVVWIHEPKMPEKYLK